MSKPADFDIDTTATRISALFRQGSPAEAVALLENSRTGRPQVVQDALDRYVLARAGDQIRPLVWCPREALAGQHDALLRLHRAADAPRMPSQADIEALPSEAQKYDVYASVVAARGNDAARASLARNGERVILGLRHENSTLDAMDNKHTRAIREDLKASGTGVYNDQLVVLWRDSDGARHVQPAFQANTEPTAQYDHHAGADGKRVFADSQRAAPRRGASDGYGEVSKPRKIESVDANGDHTRDLGRLAEGTIEMMKATHRNPVGANTNHALRPSPDAVSETRRGNAVQRDTNGDGWYDSRDVDGWHDLDASFKIHAGSSLNTDSAGCQTISPGEYKPFMDAVEGNPRQTRWQYVLTSTSPAVEHVQRAERAAAQHTDGGGCTQATPAHAATAPQRGNAHSELGASPPGHPPLDAGASPRGPDHPDHPHHALLEQIRGGVRGLDAAHGRAYDTGSEQLSRCLLAQCRDATPALALDRVDHVVLAHDGRHAFAVQGALEDAANRWAVMPVAQARQTPVEHSDTRLAAATQLHEPSREHAPALHASMAPSQRGPVLQQQIPA